MGYKTMKLTEIELPSGSAAGHPVVAQAKTLGRKPGVSIFSRSMRVLKPPLTSANLDGHGVPEPCKKSTMRDLAVIPTQCRASLRFAWKPGGGWENWRRLEMLLYPLIEEVHSRVKNVLGPPENCLGT